jgi:hypothetical protein
MRITVFGLGRGTCSLSGHEEKGVTVSFDDGTVNEQFLGWDGLERLLRLKSEQKKRSKGGKKGV